VSAAPTRRRPSCAEARRYWPGPVGIEWHLRDRAECAHHCLHGGVHAEICPSASRGAGALEQGGLQPDPTEPVHAPDGGTREFLPASRCPASERSFSATVNTEWTRYLDNGATMTVKNRRLIARDGQGRVFQERRWFVSERSVESRLTRTEISDPASHHRLLRSFSARLRAAGLQGAAAVASPHAGASPNGQTP
jgi:hypothetical protein